MTRDLDEPDRSADDASGSSGVADIFSAARDGDEKRVRRILRAHREWATAEAPKPRESYWIERPIHVAAQAGHAGVVRALLEAGAQPLEGFQPFACFPCALSIARDHGRSSVVAAIEHHLRERLDRDPGWIRAKDADGNTLLHLAVYHRQESLVGELLDRGAEVDVRNRWGQRPIHLALYCDWLGGPADRSTAELLLARGAASDIWVASALGDLAAVRRFLARDATLAGAAAGAGPTPGGAKFPLGIAALEGHVEVVRLLLEAGADPDARNRYSLGEVRDYDEAGAPLLFAISSGHLETAHLLLDHGARADAPPIESGPSPMDKALETGDRELIERMVIAGGRPGLDSCVRHHQYVVIGELLARCADAPGEPEGRTLCQQILQLAAWLGEPNVVRMCLARKPRIGNAEALDLLWSTVWTHNLVGDWDDYLTVARLLLEYGVTPAVPPDGAGESLRHGVPPRSQPLHWVSVARGRIAGNEARMVEYARLLLDHGADIEARDDEMRSTPLGWAARYGHGQLVEFLIARGANVTAPEDDPSRTPLAWARQVGRDGIVAILRRHGAKG